MQRPHHIPHPTPNQPLKHHPHVTFIRLLTNPPKTLHKYTNGRNNTIIIYKCKIKFDTFFNNINVLIEIRYVSDQIQKCPLLDKLFEPDPDNKNEVARSKVFKKHIRTIVHY